MPRHTLNPAKPETEGHDRPVAVLAGELKADGPGPLPLTLERYVPATHSRNVSIIWDKWRGVPADLRGDLIHAAYEQAEGREYADSIAVAEGVTPAEALALGLLPYSVVAIRRTDAGNSLIDFAGAMLEEGRSTVLGPEPGAGLRYAREDDAVTAVARLTAALPGSVWAIKYHADPDD